MKAERLLSALLLLQAHGRMAERELAERLEVSQRTAHRDMEALCATGIPLTAHRGVRGGWKLEKGWRTRVPGLDDAELWGLLMAQPSSAGGKRMSAAAGRAFDKLMASMPAAQKAQAESIRARLHVDATGWRPGSEDWSALPAVQDAVARDAKLTFRYRRADGRESLRTVDPLGLVAKQAAWYLVARSAEGLRTYRISRMSDVVALAVPFERPRHFDLAAWWAQSTAALEEKTRPYTAVLAMSAAAAADLAPWSPMRPAESAGRRKLPEGWRAYAVEFDSAYAAQFVAMGMGARTRVLGPEEMRKAVEKEQRAAMRGQGSEHRAPGAVHGCSSEEQPGTRRLRTSLPGR
ncbi:MAG TPA: WYL domain-containing protein [Acidobacteriaceae bacterium]